MLSIIKRRFIIKKKYKLSVHQVHSLIVVCEGIFSFQKKYIGGDKILQNLDGSSIFNSNHFALVRRIEKF